MIVLFFFIVPDLGVPDCALPNCDVCSGDNCTQCSPTFFNSEYYGCLRCYIACFYCYSGDYIEYFKCGDSSCGCDVYNNKPPNRTDCTPQSQNCYKCPTGYFHDHNLGSFCYKCLHSNCKCTEADNCPECIVGKYTATNFCQDTCPVNCVNCSDATYCDDCIHGKYGLSCESDCINTCDDGSCDKMLGTCTQCPFGKYFELYNTFNMPVCKDCPIRCAGCVDPNNCTLCDSVNYWGTTCQHDCTGCEGDCSREDGCSTGCQEGYYQEFSAAKKGYECLKCQPTCRSCDSWMTCQSCFSGFWGSRCHYSCTGCSSECDDNGCSSGCISNYYRHLTQGGYQCSQCPDQGHLPVDDVGCVPCSAISSGSCTFDGCDGGDSPIYDEGTNVLKCGVLDCPETCLSCSSEEQCDSCQLNHWGKTCQYTCSGCKGDCFISDGGCFGGCVEGLFQSYSNTKRGYECLECPQNCVSCNNGRECDTCEPNYLAVDEVGCVPCSAIRSGTCIFDGCDGGSSPIYDDVANILKCGELLCLEPCLSCSSDEQCDSCKTNHWGNTCQYTCIGCKGDCFISDGCSGGCVEGLFQSYSNTKRGYECLECPQNCVSCNNERECDTCEPSYWGDRCQFSCSGCNDNCNQLTGCDGGCLNGFYQTSINGGLICELCSNTCKNQTCNSSDGSCSDGCENSWSGTQCDTRCSSACLSCDQSNLAVCEICTDGSPGPDCKTSSAAVPFLSAILCLTVVVYSFILNKLSS